MNEARDEKVKIFIMSDIHDSPYFLKKAIETCEKENCEHIV